MHTKKEGNPRVSTKSERGGGWRFGGVWYEAQENTRHISVYLLVQLNIFVLAKKSISQKEGQAIQVLQKELPRWGQKETN